ncbi:NAD(P)-binding protein [Amniculicola lignicola CBS 123094]|uniref:NAD(P)-binding protein n=1 Tax=Amniculicola lignicola CBS 123094 TaxID=1392246 RepID=A0A6A5WSI5_9PLEO|nr:NAD(P)-binding protein [Amniculicola lignicola CBS 123094]
MSGQQTRQWVLYNPPRKSPVVLSGPNSTFAIQSATLPPPGANEVLLQILYFSNDPGQRGWISADVDLERQYLAPVQKGQVMKSFAICEVLESKSENITKGQLVMATTTGWTEYAVVDAKLVTPIQPDEAAGIRATHFIGVLGVPGITAYYGLADIAHATKDDIVVISGAGGATGSMVVQVAKHLIGSKKVIGIAGGAEKCKWVESLGADVCVDYKAMNFKEELWRATEGFVDVYFDNVGGEILDLMLQRVRRFGRITACGSISSYNGHLQSITRWGEIVTNRLEVRGFIVFDTMGTPRGAEIVDALKRGIRDGKIKVGIADETVIPTRFEDVPRTWMGLFEGKNQGKLVTELIKV